MVSKSLRKEKLPAVSLGDHAIVMSFAVTEHPTVSERVDARKSQGAHLIRGRGARSRFNSPMRHLL